jgi:hypothetical protein
MVVGEGGKIRSIWERAGQRRPAQRESLGCRLARVGGAGAAVKGLAPSQSFADGADEMGEKGSGAYLLQPWRTLALPLVPLLGGHGR